MLLGNRCSAVQPPSFTVWDKPAKCKLDAMVADKKGNIIACGNIITDKDNISKKGILIKYDMNGQVLWSRDNEVVLLSHIAVDDLGNILVSSGQHLFKYDGTGRIVWSRTIDMNLSPNNSGSIITTLNNDIVFISQEKNKWLDALLDPFKDPKVGVTGPMMIRCPYAQREFIIFFCACTRRDLLDKYGPLDEIFSPGFGEDVAKLVKMAIQQPEENMGLLKKIIKIEE